MALNYGLFNTPQESRKRARCLDLSRRLFACIPKGNRWLLSVSTRFFVLCYYVLLSSLIHYHFNHSVNTGESFIVQFYSNSTRQRRAYDGSSKGVQDKLHSAKIQSSHGNVQVEGDHADAFVRPGRNKKRRERFDARARGQVDKKEGNESAALESDFGWRAGRFRTR